MLPLDDCLYALQPTIPHLTRSSLHRCLQRHGIGRLPEVEGDKPTKRKFKSYPIGFFHIDIAEVRTEQGKLHLFVAIDRTSKFAFVELHEKATTAVARDFLLRLIAAVPPKPMPAATSTWQRPASGPSRRSSRPTAPCTRAGRPSTRQQPRWGAAQAQMDVLRTQEASARGSVGSGLGSVIARSSRRRRRWWCR